MPIRLGRFEMPKRLTKDEKSTDTYGRYSAEPFETGYGRTIGNSLRRVLLSSLEGAAISSIKIEGALHEFSALPGVTEDVTDIIINLKGVLIRLYTRETKTLRINITGPAEVTAGDIETDGIAEILNPDHHIATLDHDGKFEAELTVRIGRGYCSFEGNKTENQVIGVIPIDSLFSPIRRVNFGVEAARVGKLTDYDKLILEIWTDGRLPPDDALTRAAAILRLHMDVFVNYDADLIEFEEERAEENRERDELRQKLSTSVNEIELSVRAGNCLNNANILTIGELAQRTESEMLKFRNFGKTSLKEIKEKLADMDLTLGMTFDEEVLRPEK